jgi:hypothetical protein
VTAGRLHRFASSHFPEYGDVVTLLIADRFLEVSDYWRSDDSPIAPGANLFVSGRENGMRLRHSNSQRSC